MLRSLVGSEMCIRDRYKSMRTRRGTDLEPCIVLFVVLVWPLGHGTYQSSYPTRGERGLVPETIGLLILQINDVALVNNLDRDQYTLSPCTKLNSYLYLVLVRPRTYLYEYYEESSYKY
eukprot:TRINITY_DN13952_c0_g1_i5.p1 TRINITY_DN13952_c0_g1~~TRINITY_DN13952_c0_g1_i5.p1  ORF type:complete len:119 (+),score=7.32 TRINITY_DN13952_c0_g1_i5:129-485(+)